MNRSIRPARIIRKPELWVKVGLSDASVYRLEKKGRFPKRVQIGPNTVGWIECEVDQWIFELAGRR